MNKNYLSELELLLSKNKDYLVEEKVNKNKVAELAHKYDAELIDLLVDNKGTRKLFFVKTKNDVLIFNKDKFIQFISNKEFLPDSYTSYKNKIGLGTGTELLSEQKEVVLNWAYKDCVLEGGQDKEDAKCEEVFHNEVLAPDQIDRLLDQKVLTGLKRYSKDGEHEIKEITSEDNLIIRGNNLLVLSSLKKQYAGQVKLIYIDPPYNTEGDEFNYNDKFKRSTWLTFMRNRLVAAKELLADNGVIFVHISDKELHYLKVLMDEIFPGGFIATIPRKTRSGKSDVPYNISQDFDWMLSYTKKTSASEKVFSRNIERKYYESDDFPNDSWRLTDLTTQRTAAERPNSDFTLINPKNSDQYPVNPNRSWGVTKDTVHNYISNKRIVFPGDYPFLRITKPAMRVFKSDDDKSNSEVYVSTNFLNLAMDTLLKSATNSKGTDDMVELFGEKAFAYPKNEILMQAIIEACTSKGDIVMDFFLGSGTTTAVAHKLGRKYIGIEQMDYIQKVTVPRMKAVIRGDNAGISKDIGWTGGGSFVYCHLMDLGNKFIGKVKSATTEKELVGLLEQAQKSSFLSYKVDPEKINPGDKDFASLSVAHKKQLLLEIVDQNHLYVNYSEIDDADYGVSAQDKAINKQFYGN